MGHQPAPPFVHIEIDGDYDPVEAHPSLGSLGDDEALFVVVFPHRPKQELPVG
jgi:hypothetical protein